MGGAFYSTPISVMTRDKKYDSLGSNGVAEKHCYFSQKYSGNSKSDHSINRQLAGSLSRVEV